VRILELLSVKPFAIIGHRGAAGLARENSLRALEEAIRAGADIAEFDVQVTADEIPIASHDEIVLFDDGSKASIRSLKLDDLRSRSIGGEPIPTVQELLEHAAERIGLFLEVKNPKDTLILVNTIKKLEAREWIAIISFHEEAVAQASNHGFISGLLYFKPPGKIVECSRLKCKIVLPRFNLATEKAVEFAHRLKLKVVAWTVNDATVMEELARKGVDGIATDYPNIATSIRNTMLV
jgi:glycerophosphoryl diester phosphodiesterase